MAGHYDLSSQAQEASPYATLPGTSQAGFVPHNMTPMKSNLAPGREIAGCNPSRWVYELLNNDFTVCDLFERARHAKLESTYTWDHAHKLVMNGNQSFSTASSRVLSSICLDCHFHFVFKMTWDEAHSDGLCHQNQSSWPLRDDQFPWHHLVWVGSSSDPDIAQDNTKYCPLLAREYFVCSAPPCTFQLTLEISEPRMPQSWVELLLDREAICQQLKMAKEQEPSRYEAATDEWAYQATLNLNTYLKNLLESTPEDARSISKRNKRFAVLFGPRCFAMFRQLEFTEKVELRDGVDEGSFTPSPPPPAGGPLETTEIGTYRSYLEDVRAEVQCLIHKAGQAAEKPTIITPVLHADLGCNEVPNAATNALVNVERYKLIGVLPNQSREAVVNAYKRQWDLLPSRRRALVDSIMGIANDSRDELLSDYAITQSSVFDNQTHRPATNDDDGLVPQALNFLGLQPPNNYSADSLIQAFRQKLVRDPADATTARSMLLLIAQNSNDDMYQAQLLMEADAKMSLETSRAILELKAVEVPWKTTYEAAKKKIEASKSKEATQVYLDALEAIADHTYSPALKQAAMELRQENGIYGVKAKDEDEPVNYALPVGLHNIGNTCYLNSLLQYLFTVKPVREIVLNYDNVKLPLDDESIKARLLGGNKMQMDRGEAVVAQAFAKELSELFQNLKASKRSATKPSQRLANAVLLSTHTLLHNPKQSSEPPIGPRPPPLPARPSPAPPTQSADDVEMINGSVANALEPFEIASTSSSRTLVNQEDARSDHSYERVETVHVSGQADGATEVLSRNDDPMDQSSQSPSQSTKAATTTEATNDVQGSCQDVGMADAEIETVDQKVLNALEHQKRSSGTDQQDVEEVMGSIINRLQAAIQPSSVDEKTGIQLEKIMETFFVTTVNYTKKFDEKEYQSEISFDRSITAFPAPDGPCSLYDALGRNFDQQILEESKLSRYTAIKTLPPVLHVLIQRSQSMGSKNGNAVVIPETLYLDRYMDAPHTSPVFQRRVEDWALSDRISDLKVQISKVDSNPTYISYLEKYAAGVLETEVADGTANAESAVGEAPEIVAAPEENWDFDGPVDEDFLLVTTSTSTGSEQPIPYEPKPLNIRATDTAIRQMMEAELQNREETLKEHQESLKGTPYRLHAVICHRGHLMSGHYWVWIHDFEENTWRWYNDADVKENKNTAEVLETLSTSGEPYFLCYVRDEDKAEYVNIPKRQPPTPPSEPQESPAPKMMTDKDGDIDAVAEVVAPVIEGIEPPDDETDPGWKKGNDGSQRMQE
ncbi:ubiquitin carboxyl-terminal hydrolase [Metarhizium acridum CQMa 102]|uniref:ubiquitinyl hydrolase 1 n=1 Tax=Metarhizium acridum (strain CQMa 102) TaxID=655827 RepID=E9EC64_METAQ|nr:ubiquitin carboxyl-terminal hydrolase [Metarhizium acridum CQMa 102]EFY86490.1 ubiquitin carboxyl-terminal hydrolase [Metarhizium acridum CQMa 102]